MSFNFDDELNTFFKKCTHTLLYYIDLEEKLSSELIHSCSISYLLQENNAHYNEISEKSYSKSYADPDVCTLKFGENGTYFCFLYNYIRNCRSYAFYHQKFLINSTMELFLNITDIIKIHGQNVEKTAETIQFHLMKTGFINFYTHFRQGYDPSFKYKSDIVQNSDLSDLNYLFEYGIYVNEHTIRNARFLMNVPDEKIKQIAQQVVDCFIRGIKNDNKNIGSRNRVNVTYPISYERIIRELIKKFKAKKINVNLNPFPFTLNKQYGYDHRFDESALTLTDKNIVQFLSDYRNAAESCADLLKSCCGNIYFETFGEKTFSPINKTTCFKLSDEQQPLFQKRISGVMNIMDKYISQKEVSYCIISFPTPEIGENFEEIFDATLDINMLDSETYENIQQKMIDVLEKGTFVKIKGCGKNKTDIAVKIKEIENSDETNFANCGADVNIPVGEVYTSPVLKGTNGILHFPEIFLDGLKYIDLEFTFKDGYTAEYSCKNFNTEAENKKYIKENLFNNLDSLPLGEFAIGTNTQAFVTAKKYNILPILPILIYEKSGPHFAIGDTCFFRSEDIEMINTITKKRMIAKDNEVSILRKEDTNKAYTNCHTDMTIPFDEIEYITVIHKNSNETDIIRNGRFVLPGTEMLNIPLDEYSV